jgi:hypothetical protein
MHRNGKLGTLCTIAEETMGLVEEMAPEIAMHQLRLSLKVVHSLLRYQLDPIEDLRQMAARMTETAELEVRTLQVATENTRVLKRKLEAIEHLGVPDATQVSLKQARRQGKMNARQPLPGQQVVLSDEGDS